MFEELIRNKVRFETSRGLIHYEDVYDMKLTSSDDFNLDVLAQKLYEQKNEAKKQKSFVFKKTKKDKIAELKFNFVKHVIDLKLQEIEDNESKAENAEKRKVILEAIHEKELEDIKGKSVDELKKMAAKLK